MDKKQKPLRTPVKEITIPLKKKKWVTEVRQVVMGVDPGHRFTGVVILERATPLSPVQALKVEIIKTEKLKKKLRKHFRTTTDDQRRWKEIWSALCLIYGAYNPHALGVEAYVLNMSQKGSSAGAKTLGVYTGVLWWGWTRNMYSTGYLPQDVKRRFCGNQSATKLEVQTAICQQVIGLEEMANIFPEKQHEHIFDAAGQGVLVLEEIEETRKMLGLI